MRRLDRHQKVGKSEIEEHLKMFFFRGQREGAGAGSKMKLGEGRVQPQMSCQFITGPTRHLAQGYLSRYCEGLLRPERLWRFSCTGTLTESGLRGFNQCLCSCIPATVVICIVALPTASSEESTRAFHTEGGVISLTSLLLTTRKYRHRWVQTQRWLHRWPQ